MPKKVNKDKKEDDEEKKEDPEIKDDEKPKEKNNRGHYTFKGSDKHKLHVCKVCGECQISDKLVRHYDAKHKDETPMWLTYGDMPCEPKNFLKFIIDQNAELKRENARLLVKSNMKKSSKHQVKAANINKGTKKQRLPVLNDESDKDEAMDGKVSKMLSKYGSNSGKKAPRKDSLGPVSSLNEQSSLNSDE